MNENYLQFISHNVRHPRNMRLLQAISRDCSVLVSHHAMTTSGQLGFDMGTVKDLIHLGVGSRGCIHPFHLDGIDVIVYPLLSRSEFLLDLRCPLPVELRWLGQTALASACSLLLSRALSRARVIIAPNSQMLNLGARGANTEHLYVVPNFPPMSFRTPGSQKQFRDRLGLAEDMRICVFVGGARLREVYGLDLLLAAWRLVVKRDSGAHLFVAGDVSNLGYSKNVFKIMKDNNVHFLGVVAHENLPFLIGASDVCLAQRTPGFPEDFYNDYDSLKISEYALFEKPIVAAGYLRSSQYLSAETQPTPYAEAILSALNEDAPKPKPRSWEENQNVIEEAYSWLFT